ncbi:MAG: hypothetical protein R3B93_00955 [Bacteroidia bacterium]
MAEKRNRYPGVQPYQTKDRDLFFGRDEDIENLHDFLMLEKLVVLFGKSGYGKSSLLSAGLVPRLTDPDEPKHFRFQPLEIRFGNYAGEHSPSPLVSAQEIIKQLPANEGMDFLQTEDPGLWRQLKQKQTAEQNQFVLIFDQFEEFFSYPPAQQQIFRKQLAELLYATLPTDVQEQLDELTGEQIRAVLQPMQVKVILSIRSDRMSLLDSMKDTLPAILHKRYELKPLNLNQAREAIVQPALKGNDEAQTWKETFITPPFEYTPSALKKIEQELTSEIGDGIEAFQLQIVCAEIEKAIRQGKIPDRDGNGLPDVDVADLPDFRNLYEIYYQSKLEEIPENQRLAAQRVLEDGLLATDPQSGEGRRMSVDSRALLGQFSQQGLTETLLRQLELTYLIRREANTVGGFSYEISHDTLVAPIQKAKAERLAEEERAAARKRIRRLVGIVSIVGALLVGAGLLTAYAFRQQDLAQKAQKDAEQKTQEAEEARQEAVLEKEKADSLKNLAEENLLKANIANLETNREKLRAAQDSLNFHSQLLEDYRINFPAQVPKVQRKVNRARRIRNLYQSKVDSLENIVNP